MRKLLVILPFHRGDFQLALDLLKWIEELGGCKDFSILLLASHKVLNLEMLRIDVAAKLTFGEVILERCNTGLQDESWPRGANMMFRRGCQIVHERFKRPFLWMEPDCVPLKPGWLGFLEDEYQRCGKPFIGNIRKQTTNPALPEIYLPGCSIYPANAQSILHSRWNPVTVAWDVTTAGITVPMAAETALIFEWWGIKGRPPLFKASRCDSDPTNVMLPGQIPAEAVFFHRSKDGALIKLLRPPILNNHVEVFPSFRKQTKFKSGMFRFPDDLQPYFPHEPLKFGVCHFNPSIESIDGRKLLFTRRLRYRYSKGPKIDLEAFSDLSIWEIGEGKQLSFVASPKHASSVSMDHWEDPRTIQIDGKIHVSFAAWNGAAWKTLNHPIHQVIASLECDFSELHNPNSVAYGKNGPERTKNMGHEKNWTWFIHAGQLYMIYMICPHEVVMIESGWKAGEQMVGKDWSYRWPYGIPRGGSNPMLVGDRFFGFFHSRHEPSDKPFRYYMGAYSFPAKLPFEVDRVTTKPILTGSRQDPHIMNGPPCIFPGGAILEDQKWLVVFGVNDENCGWIEIPHRDLEERMVAV